MRPGEMFGVYRRAIGGRCFPTVFVVLDATHEVDFWTGALAAYGDICPISHFEVLS